VPWHSASVQKRESFQIREATTGGTARSQQARRRAAPRRACRRAQGRRLPDGSSHQQLRDESTEHQQGRPRKRNAVSRKNGSAGGVPGEDDRAELTPCSKCDGEPRLRTNHFPRRRPCDRARHESRIRRGPVGDIELQGVSTLAHRKNRLRKHGADGGDQRARPVESLPAEMHDRIHQEVDRGASDTTERDHPFSAVRAGRRCRTSSGRRSSAMRVKAPATMYIPNSIGLCFRFSVIALARRACASVINRLEIVPSCRTDPHQNELNSLDPAKACGMTT